MTTAFRTDWIGFSRRNVEYHKLSAERHDFDVFTLLFETISTPPPPPPSRNKSLKLQRKGKAAIEYFSLQGLKSRKQAVEFLFTSSRLGLLYLCLIKEENLLSFTHGRRSGTTDF